MLVLVGIGDVFRCAQTQNGVRQISPETFGIFTKVFYTSDAYLVILAWTGHKLSRGQESNWNTHGQTQTRMQAMTIPEDQNWPQTLLTNTNLRDLIAATGLVIFLKLD